MTTSCTDLHWHALVGIVSLLAYPHSGHVIVASVTVTIGVRLALRRLPYEGHHGVVRRA
ncbi:hypothetical protein BH18ACT16_BH18ACT16_17030 [soil metagenome]